MVGVISGFTSRIPTQAELDDFSFHVELTLELEWDPHSADFSVKEDDHDDTWKDRRVTLRANALRRHWRSCRLNAMTWRSGCYQWCAQTPIIFHHLYLGSYTPSYVLKTVPKLLPNTSPRHGTLVSTRPSGPYRSLRSRVSVPFATPLNAAFVWRCHTSDTHV